MIPLVLKVALGQRPDIKVFGTDYPTPDGSCIRDYVHVADLVAAHLLALESLESGEGRIYNLGSGRGYSVKEVIDVAREVTGHDIPAEEIERRPGDPARLVASSEKIQRELGWEPDYPELRQIVDTAWQWHSNHPDGWGI